MTFFKKTYALYFFLLVLTLVAACQPKTDARLTNAKPDHSAWNTLLEEHVGDEGIVDYKGFMKDSVLLNAYLNELKAGIPDKISWTRNEQLAYWINAYNAFTIKLILKHYPVESIKDIGSSIQIPFVNSPWDIKFINIGGQKFDLNNIEHSILRKEFDEPRIHFAIVCASISCPNLRNEAYTADKIEDQLQEEAISFINDPAKNDIASKGEIEISKIFSWFKGDFTKEGSVVDFLNLYASEEIDPDADVSHKKYDWGLNE